ncbi:MAG: glycoside hydrolase family 20 zincin-like fold domain-containing protein, partial [Candidatus Angelobacter sp.]
MRFLLSATACLLASCAIASSAQSTPTCADLHLVPAPRECTAVKSVAIGSAGIRIVSGKDAEDEFAAKDLEESLKERGVPVGRETAAIIRFERISKESAKEKFEKPEEAYAIAPASARAFVVSAATDAGIFYGAQTVKQLVRGSGKDAVLLVPTIRDWPAMPHRGISDDWSRGPLPNMDFLKREIRTLAAYKCNIFSPYFEHTFAYASTPVAAFPGGAMTPEEGRELVAYAAKYHITIIPEQEAFGHLHNVLKFEQYSSLGETPHGAVLAPGDPASLPQIGEWFGELAKVFPGPYAHIGADETDQ